MKLIRVVSLRGVPVMVHWSVPALCIFLLGAGLPRIFMVATGLGCYLSILFIHELGHHYAAVRRGYHVYRIDVFPLHAVCRLEHPETPADLAFISAGGPLAQLLLAIPFTVCVLVFGFTRFQTLNAVLAILGYFSPLLAIVNLIPIAPLDGKAAWTLIPLSVGGRRLRKPSQSKTALEALEEARDKAIRNARKR